MLFTYVGRYEDGGQIEVIRVDREPLDAGHGATTAGSADPDSLRASDGGRLKYLGPGAYERADNGRRIRSSDPEAP